MDYSGAIEVDMRKRLSECADGQEGVIVSVDDEAGWGMECAGFVPGSVVRVLRRSVFGEPVQVELKNMNATFAVSSEILKLVIVDDESAAG